MLKSCQISCLLSKGGRCRGGCGNKDIRSKEGTNQNVKENGVHVVLELQLIARRSGPGLWWISIGPSLMITILRTWCYALFTFSQYMNNVKVTIFGKFFFPNLQLKSKKFLLQIFGRWPGWLFKCFVVHKDSLI